MILDCDTCAVRDVQCGDCVVPVLLGGPPGRRDVDESERRALQVLADSGLVPRLRLVPTGLPAALVGEEGTSERRTRDAG